MKVKIHVEAEVDLDYSDYSVEDGDDEALAEAIESDFEDMPSDFFEAAKSYRIDVKVEPSDLSSDD